MKLLDLLMKLQWPQLCHVLFKTAISL